MSIKPGKYFTVSMPCKPYIQKYAEVLFGNPVPAHNNSTIGCFVKACLEKNFYSSYTFTQSFIDAHYTGRLQMQISEWQFARVGHSLSTEKVKEINRFLENMFEEHMFMYVGVHHKDGETERKKVIDHFASMHNIATEVDITLEALVKTEYRQRKKVRRIVERQTPQLALFFS